MKILRAFPLILFLSGLSGTWASAQSTNDAAIASPREAMTTFIYAVKRFSLEPELWGDVSRLLAADHSLEEPELERRAVELYGILNRLGKVEAYDLPDEASVAARNLDAFVYYPNVAIHPEELNDRAGTYEIRLVPLASGDWGFSAKTIGNIPNLYKALEGESIKYGTAEFLVSPSLWLRSKLPAKLTEQRFASLQVWQWVGLLLLIVMGLVTEIISRLLLRLAVMRWVRRSGGQVEKETLAHLLKPFGLFVSSLTVFLLLPLLGLHYEETETAHGILRGAVTFFVVVSAAWALWRLVDLVAEVLINKAAKTENKVDDVLIPLARKAVKIFIAIFGTIYGAESISLPIAPLLTSLGIGGLAFAFAAKDTIENLFGSVAVILDHPFSVGDWVVIGKTEGTVEQVGFRSTRIRTFYNSLVTVPNSSLVRAEVDNYGKRRYRRVKCHLGIEYGTTPEKIVAFTEGIRELVRTHPYTRKDYYQVYFNQFGPSSLDILLYVFHETPDWSTELRERERLFLDILRLADRLGVNFAFPTQTLHLHQEENGERIPMSAPARETDAAAAELGRQAVQDLIANQEWRDSKPAPV